MASAADDDVDHANLLRCNRVELIVVFTAIKLLLIQQKLNVCLLTAFSRLMFALSAICHITNYTRCVAIPNLMAVRWSGPIFRHLWIMAKGVPQRQVVMTLLNWPIPKTPLWYRNLGIISYGNRVIANTAVRGLSVVYVKVVLHYC